MKKSFNVNLGGRIFQIDEDAYVQLNDYLVSVKTCFMNNECGEEIAEDIEQRMGELFEARMTEGLPRIVTISLVNEMIARMGKPESMVEDEEGCQSSRVNAEDSSDKENNSSRDADNRIAMGKKLFRDGDKKLLGGVVSGCAAYFGMDVTLLRVIAVFLFFLTTFWAFVLYLVLWAILPLALTTTDKLRMNGVEPTPENIAEELAYKEPAVDRIVRNLKEVDNNGIKNLLVILGCVLFLSLFVSGFTNGMFPVSLLFCWISSIALLAIPAVAVVLVLTKKWNSLTAGVKWLLLIDWTLALGHAAFMMNSFSNPLLKIFLPLIY